MNKDLLVYNSVGIFLIVAIALVLYFLVLPMSHSSDGNIVLGRILYTIGVISIVMILASLVDETIRGEMIRYFKTLYQKGIKKKA